MSADRWTQETENLVAMALEDVLPREVGALPDEAFYEDARNVLRELADAGLLVEPGSETYDPYAAAAPEHGRCDVGHPDHPLWSGCHRPRFHAPHVINDDDGGRLLWLDSYQGEGGETRVEWGTRWSDGQVSKPMSEESARHWVASDRARGVAKEATDLVRRTVHTGPWIPLPTAAAPASAAVPLSQPPTTAPGERGGVESPSTSPP